MNQSEQVKHILIVGGGTAGWMAASLLHQGLGKLGCRITLIESADIGTVGVGEATTPDVVKMVQRLELDADDFMRRCQATYKLAIPFVNWMDGGDEFWHPFGPVGGFIDGRDLFHFWYRSVCEGESQASYCSYSVHQRLAELGKGPRNATEESHIIQHGSYAYHLDATAFAAMLKGIALEKGIVHFFDEVSDVVLDSSGAIESLQTKAGRELTADLYLDCTGFRGTLIEKAMGDGWTDWSDLLLCNRALVASIPQQENISPYTTSTALSAGWLWEIPLSHRLSTGYVYSDKFLDEEQATKEFVQFAGSKGVGNVRPRSIQFRVGRRENFWHKNCVAIGLAAGFIEPLESTGLALVARGVDAIMQFLPDCRMSPMLAAQYNREVGLLYEEIRDFIVLHYLVNRRVDTGFWKASREVDVPDSLARALQLYDETGLLDRFRKNIFGEPSYYCICSGANRLPEHTLPITRYVEMEKILQVLSQIKSQNEQWVHDLPSHGELIAQIHRRGEKLL